MRCGSGFKIETRKTRPNPHYWQMALLYFTHRCLTQQPPKSKSAPNRKSLPALSSLPLLLQCSSPRRLSLTLCCSRHLLLVRLLCCCLLPWIPATRTSNLTWIPARRRRPCINSPRLPTTATSLCCWSKSHFSCFLAFIGSVLAITDAIVLILFS